MITIDELFSEDFEPVWMTRQREAALQNWLEQLNLCTVKRARKRWRPKDRADERWQQEAQRSSRNIDRKCKGVWYHN